jgi:hypothetical protein
MISYEEKLLRYIASKFIQKKFFLKKHRYPSDSELQDLIQKVLVNLKEEYKQLSLVRKHSSNGILTPIVKRFVEKLNF